MTTVLMITAFLGCMWFLISKIATTLENHINEIKEILSVPMPPHNDLLRKLDQIERSLGHII